MTKGQRLEDKNQRSVTKDQIANTREQTEFDSIIKKNVNTKYITMKTPILKAAMLAAAMLIFCSQSEARILRQQLSTVKGTVVDAANGEPLGWATVALLDVAGNVVTGIACDEKGSYEIQTETGDFFTEKRPENCGKYANSGKAIASDMGICYNKSSIQPAGCAKL